jgi:hypothetical protein
MTSAGKISFLLAALLFSVVAAEKNCTQSNGYKHAVCGSGLKDDQQLCCKEQEKCIQVKPFSGPDKVTCSEARQVTNTKALKIVIIPLFFLLADVGIIIYMVLRCKAKESPITMLCVAAVGLSWPFLFSKHWAFGAYTAFLATMVAAAAAPSIDSRNMPFWTYRLVLALSIFHLIALLGPNEPFHVPLFGESKAAANSEMIKNIYNEADCNTYYHSYFTVLDIEKEVKNVDPDEKYHSFCQKNWLATIQSFAIVQSLLWIAIIFVSAPSLLTYGGGWVDKKVGGWVDKREADDMVEA